MEANPAPKISKTTIKYIAIGLSGLVLIGGAYQLFKRFKPMNQRERILKILQETRKELFPVLKSMADTKNKRYGSATSLPKQIADELLNTRNYLNVLFLWLS